MNIFVAKLSYDSDESDVRRAFETYGSVDTVKVIMDRDTGKSKGFGFVEMPDNDEALRAIESLNESELDGQTIVVKQADDRRQQRPKQFKPRPGGDRNDRFNRSDRNDRWSQNRY